MSTFKYKIEFLSYWAVGSGKGGGYGADSVVLKEKGLPIIPGKTLKGLWREAFAEAFPNEVVDFFGHAKKTGKDEEDQDGNKNSKINFGTARLPEVLRKALENNKSVSKELYNTRTSTEVDSGKQAVENSLRKMEVCVPLVLEAEIDGVSDDLNDKLSVAMQGIRMLGEKRYRGLGRCKFDK
jgi:CRISPR/Cas system CSM-associated protein Csm3 (group 7 of RAMP superfamily)